MVLGVFDLLTVAVGAVGYLLGRSRGFAWQVSGLLTLVVGALCATVLSRPLGPLFAEGMGGRFAAWVVVYAVVAICLYVLTLKLKHKLKELEYDELDKRFGAILGAAKGLGIFAVLTLVAVAVSANIESAVKRSLAGQALRALVHEARPLLPDRIHDSFGPWLDRVNDAPAPAPPPRWPEPSPPAAPVRPATPVQPAAPGPAAPPPARPLETAGPPAPPPARPSPPVAPSPGRRPSPARPLEAGATRQPSTSSPPPRDPPVDDPFDTSRDPVDPLAPPR